MIYSPGPRVCIIDSQMVKTIHAAKGSKYNGWKKKRGRKKHVVTDSNGNVLDIVIHQGSIHDTKMGWKVLRKVLKRYPTIEFVIVDKRYQGTTKIYADKLLNLEVKICN